MITEDDMREVPGIIELIGEKRLYAVVEGGYRHVTSVARRCTLSCPLNILSEIEDTDNYNEGMDTRGDEIHGEEAALTKGASNEMETVEDDCVKIARRKRAGRKFAKGEKNLIK